MVDTAFGNGGKADPRPPFCSMKVWDLYGFRRCARSGVVEHGSGWYCWQHDPERKAREAREKQSAAAERERLNEENRERGLDLGRRLGVLAVVDFDRKSHAYVKRLTIAFADAERLAARLEAAEGNKGDGRL